MKTETRQKLFDYFSQEHGITLMDSDFNELEAIAHQEIKEGERVVLDVDFNNSSVVTVIAIGGKNLMATVTDGKNTWDVMFNRLYKIIKP